MITLRFRKVSSLAAWLFRRVYTEVAALVWIDDCGIPVTFELFDTFVGMPRAPKTPAPNLTPVIISNRPGSEVYINLEEQHFLRQMKEHFGSEPNLYIYANGECHLCTIGTPRAISDKWLKSEARARRRAQKNKANKATQVSERT